MSSLLADRPLPIQPSEIPTEAAANHAFDTVCAYLGSLDARSRVAVSERLRRRLDAVEAEALASRIHGDPQGLGSAKAANDAAQRAGVSRREQRRRVDRARAVAGNPDLAKRLADGSISTDHADAVARAAKRTDGAAARDADLLDRIAAATADQANRLADEWADAHADRDRVQSEHDRQRRNRGVRRSTTKNGLAAITVSGDQASVDIAWRHLNELADRLYRQDGGRDVPSAEHPRSLDQRRFDAAVELLSNQSSGGSRRRGRRPKIVITTKLDTDSISSPHLVGTGPIADTLFDTFRCDADLVGLVFGQDGQPLWLGQSVRTVTDAQWTALMARDLGCVLCGADPFRCEAHHLLPVNAPARGPTDITNLALLDQSCHHHVHDAGLTLVRNADGTWSTRPAEPHERPAPRPPP